MPVAALSTTQTQAIEEDGDPVAEFISALILTGQYRPDAFGVPDEAIVRWRKVHELCKDVQRVVGSAPAPAQVRKRFPNFPFATDIPVEWAAHQLHSEYLSTRLSRTAADMSRHLVNGDPAQAYQTFVEAGRRIQPTTAAAIDILDDEVLDEELAAPFPIAPGTLMDLTGGIRPGELWFIGARPGRGKTWDLIRHAAAVTAAGLDVVYFSMEMSYKDISDRYLAVTQGWERMKTWNRSDRNAARDLMRSTRGSFRVVDPSVRRCDTMAVASSASENTLLVVDHVGLMKSGTGARSIEDYRIAATISNELKEIALKFSVPIMAASQLNRRSEAKSEPTLSDLAQTDASGQDADLVYAITSVTGSAVQQCTVVKHRRGRSGARWYTHFQPGLPTFEEISRTKAQALLEAEFASSASL